MTSLYSKTSVFIHAHDNDKLVFSKNSTLGTILNSKPSFLVPKNAVCMWMEGSKTQKKKIFLCQKKSIFVSKSIRICVGGA